MIETGWWRWKQWHKSGWPSIPCHHHGHHQCQPPVVRFYIYWFLDFINILSSLVWRPWTMVKYCKFFFCLQFFAILMFTYKKIDYIYATTTTNVVPNNDKNGPRCISGHWCGFFFLLFYYTNLNLLLNRQRWWPTWSPAPDNTERGSRHVGISSPQVTFHFFKCIVCSITSVWNLIRNLKWR